MNKTFCVVCGSYEVQTTGGCMRCGSVVYNPRELHNAQFTVTVDGFKPRGRKALRVPVGTPHVEGCDFVDGAPFTWECVPSCPHYIGGRNE